MEVLALSGTLSGGGGDAIALPATITIAAISNPA